jgi:hypothetical protein
MTPDPNNNNSFAARVVAVTPALWRALPLAVSDTLSRDLWEGPSRQERKERHPQNVKRTPSWAVKGIPTVVPGPKKSPSAPAGTLRSLRVTGRVEVQAALRHT